MLRKTIAAAAVVAYSAVSAEAVTYGFLMNIDEKVIVVGSFEVDSFDGIPFRTDYSLTFLREPLSFTGTPANTAGIQTWDLTFSSDRKSVVAWEISMSFRDATTNLSFSGNSFRDGGYAGVHDFNTGYFSAFQQPAPVLTANLLDEKPTAIPLPAGLPLMAGALGLLALARRR